MNMFTVIQHGADAAVAADPKSLAQARADRLDRVMAECVERLGAPPMPMPLPPIPHGPYYEAPCDNPRERYGAVGFTPWCMCGFPMGAHKTAKVIEFPASEIDERVGAGSRI